MKPSLFLETVCIRDGQAQHWDDHLQRIAQTLAAVGTFETLQQVVGQMEQQLSVWCEMPKAERQRGRLVYSAEGVQEASLHPYQPRIVRSLRLVEAPSLRYNYKYAHRAIIDSYFQKRGKADDVLLTQNGWLRDTSIANIALFDGTDWWTPDAPLLAGTHRSRLLREGLLRPAALHRDNLARFSRLRCFNAMLDWGEVEIAVNQIL